MNNQICVVIWCICLYACGMKSNPPEMVSSTQDLSPKDSMEAALDTTANLGALEATLIAQGLMNIQTVDSTILVELKYSTTDNFVGVDVYGDLENCYLQPEVAQMLKQAHAYLKADYPDYRFLIYDGARPLRVQQILWDTLDAPLEDKPKYVADPKEGSIHNYGSAIDLTVADTAGNPLDMGTGYDHFGYLAFPIHEEELLQSGELSEAQVQNRKILRNAMEKAGFSTITSEWWHFNAFSRNEAARRYAIIE